MSEPKQYVRKQIVIDKKFQFKTTFTVIGIVSILAAIIIGGIAAYVAYNNVRIENIYEIEKNVVEFLNSRTMGSADPVYKNSIMEVAKNHDTNMHNLKNIIFTNKVLLVVLLVSILLQGTVLYILLIRKTHKISGPIYVMSNYMRDIIKGNYPTPRKLRKGDELVEFYDLFAEMVDVLKKRAK